MVNMDICFWFYLLLMTFFFYNDLIKIPLEFNWCGTTVAT